MTENINKPIPINLALVWDYDIPPAEKQTAAFRRWYLARVLTRGNSSDLRAIGVSSQKVVVEHKINEKYSNCYRNSNKGKLS